MPEAARLVLVADSTSLKQGENALDSLARTGGRVEGKLTVDMGKIERAMASLGGVMGNLDKTMQAVERAVSGSVGRAQQETTKAARTFDDLRRAIDPAYAASQRFAEVQAELAALVGQGAAKQSEANQVLEIARSRYLGIATAAEAAEEAQRQQAQAVAQATGNFQALRAAVDPIYAASKRYEAAIETADAALKSKIITETEHARVLQMAASKMLAIAPSAEQAGAATQKFGLVANQLGYQIQDVFVSAPMVGWFRAVAQQAPQAAGAFAMLGGSIGTIVPWIGTAIAVGAALMPMFVAAGKEAKTTEDAINDLTGSLNSYRDAVTNALMPMDELWKKFGQGAQAARETYAAMVEIERIQYFKEMSATVATLTGDLQGITKAVQDWQAATKLPDFMREEAIAGAGSAAQALATAFGLSVVEAHRVANAIQSFKAASDAGPREAAAASRALGDQLMRAYEASGRTNDELLASAERSYQFSINAQEAARALGDADAAAAGAATSTQNWAIAMAGVRSEILGIVSALSQIGGGMISNAAKFVEINALKAGRSVAEARVEMEKFNVAAKYDGQIMAAEARGGIFGWTEAQALKAAKSMEMAGIAATTEADALRKNAAEAERAATSKGRSGGASSAAAKESAKLAANLDREAERWRDLLDPMSRYRRDAAQLAQLTGILSKGEMAEAQKRLNVELADSLPLAGKFVDIMSEGLLNGFSGTLSSMWDMLKSWLANAIAMAAKNRIVIAMGLGGIGAGDALTSALGAAGAPIGGVGGAAGSILGGITSFAGSVMSGASGFLTAAGGGIGSAATYTGFMLKGATASLTGFASALGAIALPVAAVAAVFSFFKTKTKQLDAGLRVTIDGLDALTETFEKVEKKKFWGLSKKVRTYYDTADAETQRAVENAINGLQAGVLSAADVLGFGAKTFEDFAHTVKISTKGMSDEEAQKALIEAIGGVSDAYASMIPGLNRLAEDGETASQALSRLSGALVGVNGIMDTLGHRFRAAGLSGADTASKIADAFGGLDAMAQSTQAFYGAFYSDAERLATTTRQTAKAMADLGIAMPQTRKEYRAIIGAMDLTTERGRATYAALIGLSGAFDQILPQIAGFTARMAKLQDRVATALGTVLDGLSDAIKINAAAAADWRKAGTGIREYLDKLRGTASALFTPQQALAFNRSAYQRTLQQAMGGNVEAAQALPGAAQTYLSSVGDTARTREEAALAQARVAAALGKVAVKSDMTATALEAIAGLQQRQVDLLSKAQADIAAGNALTREGIEKLIGSLGLIDERILKRASDAGVIVEGFGKTLKSVGLNVPGADGLRTALNDLRAAIMAETKRQQDAVKAAAGVVNKPTPAPAALKPATPTKPKAYTLDDYQVRTSQVGGSNGMGDKTRIVGPLGGVKTFDSHYGGSRSQALAWLKAQNYPAFALGGDFAGGLRIVGERGPELEATGPSRIYNAQQTRQILAGGDNREIVAELRALRQEVAELRAHAQKTAENTRSINNIQRDIQQNGISIDPTQNKVTV
ncbi:hypothetical protein PARHAE_02044 [Paracoccus haematequi]|uniref:Prophage tail length tape measure protein n=1 Tax=Paracoccus haematequi TaxID=2491866 RepID=A0A447INB0_9RHOB|nr:hypothetical protein [Paracoccus haematequi]VDS08859.1 hypothetical protein PARHAE_02044 [Paracoccus haematequi]